MTDILKITTCANARIDELFEDAEHRALAVPRITVGMVRTVLDVARELEAEQQLAETMLVKANGAPGLVDAGIALGKAAVQLQAAKPEPEHSNGTRPTQLDETTQNPAGKRYGLPPHEFRSLVLSEIRRIAGPGGTWLPIADWDAARTTKLPTAGGVTKRLGCRWTDVVVEALGERATPPDRVQRMNQAKQQEAQTKPEPPPDFRQKLDATVPSALEALAEPPAALAAPSAHLPWSPEKRRTVLRDILAELAMMADDGIMPSQSDWDARKPAALPTASTICVQWEISWAELAGYAKLSIAHKGRPPKRGAVPPAARNGAARPTAEVLP